MCYMWIKAKVDSCQDFTSIHVFVKNFNTFGLCLAKFPNFFKFFTLTGINVLITSFITSRLMWLYESMRSQNLMIEKATYLCS